MLPDCKCHHKSLTKLWLIFGSSKLLSTKKSSWNCVNGYSFCRKGEPSRRKRQQTSFRCAWTLSWVSCLREKSASKCWPLSVLPPRARFSWSESTQKWQENWLRCMRLMAKLTRQPRSFKRSRLRPMDPSRTKRKSLLFSIKWNSFWRGKTSLERKSWAGRSANEPSVKKVLKISKLNIMASWFAIRCTKRRVWKFVNAIRPFTIPSTSLKMMNKRISWIYLVKFARVLSKISCSTYSFHPTHRTRLTN